MRKLTLITLAALAGSVWAVTPEEFGRVVDFSMSTDRLYELVVTGEYDRIDPDRAFILTGSVASTTVLYMDPDYPEDFQALIELVVGRWNDLSSISVFRVYVLAYGPDFAPRVPVRMPSEPGPEIIRTNQELIVVAVFAGVAPDASGVEIPVVEALAIR